MIVGYLRVRVVIKSITDQIVKLFIVMSIIALLIANSARLIINETNSHNHIKHTEIKSGQIKN